MRNNYDDPEFFRRYRELRLNDTGINGLIEEPAIRRRLGNPTGLTILDIGCGFGHMARWLVDQGATRVLGVDPSQRMIDEARRLSESSAIEYRCGFAEELPEDESFDLVASSMALHYVEDLAALFRKVRRLLRPAGRLVFSMEHPICTAAQDGYATDEGGKFWRLSRYFETGLRRCHWFVDGIEKHHRTMAEIVTALLGSGFVIEALEEPKATCPENEVEHPMAAYFWIRPSILVMSAQRNQD